MSTRKKIKPAAYEPGQAVEFVVGYFSGRRGHLVQPIKQGLWSVRGERESALIASPTGHFIGLPPRGKRRRLIPAVAPSVWYTGEMCTTSHTFPQ